jgi:LysM repeat protein
MAGISMLKIRLILVFCLVFLTLVALRTSPGLAYNGGSIKTSTEELRAASLILIYQIQTSTPESDGSVYHTVQPGDTIYSIANAYGVSEAELLAINGLTRESVIFPGNRLIIRRGPTPTPTLDITDTPSPTITLRPTNTPTPVPTRAPTRTPTPAPPTPTSTPEPALSIGGIDLSGDPFLLVIGGLALSGAVLMGFGTLLKKRDK